MTTSTNNIALLYGGTTSKEAGATFRDFYSADAARNKFCNELRRMGRSTPQTELKKTDKGWIWKIK